MKKVDHPKSKRFKDLEKMIDPKKAYPIEEAIDLAKKTAQVKFDATIEAHFNLSIDPKKSDQQVRHSVILPNGSGQNIRIAVLTGNGEQQKNAKAAGADLVGEADLLEEIKKGKIDFDVLVAAPDTMKLLGPVAKMLGPRGLMPNPKDGTVTNNIAEAVKNLKKGQINYKNDDSGNLHVIIGKASFDQTKLIENFQALLDSVTKAKPTGAKGAYIKNISLNSTMGPGIKVVL